MIILGLILLGPFVVIAAVLGARFLEWQRLLPAGLPRFTPLCLIASGLLGSLLAGDTLEAFVASPIRLQRHFAGAVYLSPLALQSVERSGFQDPGTTWTYTLDDETLRALRARCKVQRSFPGQPEYCNMGSDFDERYYAGMGISGRATLVIEEGLH
ncbi:MAG TPA: hypothetical protein VGC35_02795 [Allosphingosinicella sp.]|jgi:hypothetical protein